MIDTVLYLLSFVLLLLESLNVGVTNIKLGWLGLALFILTFLV
jgi:hypothetical protein